MKRLFLLFICILCVSLYAFGVEDRAASVEFKGSIGPLPSSGMYGQTVTYKTYALQLVSMEPIMHYAPHTVMQSVRLFLRNVDARTITAFSVSIGSLTVTKDSALGTRDGIPPGAVEQLDLPVSSNQAADEQQITIVAAVFADGTGDGDHDRVAIIQAKRSGYGRQLSRILPLLQHVIANYPEVDDQQSMGEILNDLIIQVSRLPESPERGHPPESRLHAEERDGLRSAKERIIRQILQHKERFPDPSHSKPLLRYMLEIDKAHCDNVLRKLQGGAK